MHSIARQNSSDFHEFLYRAADFKLGERHVIKNEKKLHWTDSEFDRTYFLFDQKLIFNAISVFSNYWCYIEF